MKRSIQRVLILFLVLSAIIAVHDEHAVMAKKDKSKQDEKTTFTLPKNVLSLEKANTHPNTTMQLEMVEPSGSTKELMESIDVPIENIHLIKLLNETSIKPSPIAIGYRGSIYLGRWPLTYQSESTTVNWDYQKINENKLNNKNGRDVEEIRYLQEEKKEIKGALANKIEQPEVIKQMMLQKATAKTKLPLSFSTIIGANSRLDNYYHVPANKVGYLHAYAPAINEKGQVVFGEVTIELKGHTKKLVIKNVTKQGVGAWIPIQDHVALTFQTK